MATADLIGDVSTAVTKNVLPLANDFIPGATQGYAPAPFENPVFFAPQTGRENLLATWGNLLRGSVRSFYTSVSGLHQVPFSCAGPSTFTWDRLSVELMRIANLGQNWDGEGAEPVPLEAVKTAAVLLFLAKSTVAHIPVTQCTFPSITPAVEGGVTVNWIRGGKELKCTVLGSTVEVVRWRSPDRYESDGLWEIPAWRVAEHFEWLLR